MHGSNKATWDATARTYDLHRRGDLVYETCLQRAVSDLQPRGVVLDAGCGTGLATRLLRSAAEVHAVDYSSESLAVLQHGLRSWRNLHLWESDIRALPFADGFFDCVLCANTLQHLDRTGQKIAAKELMRVLKPRGRYSVSVHHYGKEKQRAGWVKEGKPGQQNVDYIYRFTRRELLELFPDAHIRAVGFYGLPLQRFISDCAGHALAHVGLGHMLVAHGQK